MSTFYDSLTPFYHLIYPDWPASMRQQGQQLATLLATEWPGQMRVLDVSCGIGTQAIGLAMQGYEVTGSDLSPVAVERAKQEATRYEVSIPFSVGDMQHAHACHGTGFDVVISCDNSLPHLLTDEAVLAALREMWACISPGGGCVVSLRDYAQEPRGKNLVKVYGAREELSKRYLLLQVWDWELSGEYYDFSFYVVEEDLTNRTGQTHILRSRYYALSVAKLSALMREAGFQTVRQVEGDFYQPLLVGTKPTSAS